MSQCEQCVQKASVTCLRCAARVCRSHARRGHWRGRSGACCSFCAEYSGIVSKNSVPAGTLAGGNPPDSPRDVLSVRAVATANAYADKSELWLMWHFDNNACACRDGWFSAS